MPNVEPFKNMRPSDRLVFPASTFLLLFGGVAVVSRLRLSSTINTQFVGGMPQSWFEHFLSGFAASSLLLMILIFNWDYLMKSLVWAKEVRLIKWTHAWLVSRNQFQSNIFAVMGSGVGNIVAEGFWEHGQIKTHGYFQFDQYACDVGSTLIWMFLMILYCRKLSETKK